MLNIPTLISPISILEAFFFFLVKHLFAHIILTVTFFWLSVFTGFLQHLTDKILIYGLDFYLYPDASSLPFNLVLLSSLLLVYFIYLDTYLKDNYPEILIVITWILVLVFLISLLHTDFFLNLSHLYSLLRTFKHYVVNISGSVGSSFLSWSTRASSNGGSNHNNNNNNSFFSRRPRNQQEEDNKRLVIRTLESLSKARAAFFRRQYCELSRQRCSAWVREQIQVSTSRGYQDPNK